MTAALYFTRPPRRVRQQHPGLQVVLTVPGAARCVARGELTGRELFQRRRLALAASVARQCEVVARWWDVEALEVVPPEQAAAKRAWPSGIVVAGRRVLGTWETRRT